MIAEGWYIPKPDDSYRVRRRPRWVLGQYRDWVCYSTGGTSHRHVLVDSFERWLQRTEARPALELRREGLEDKALKELRHG